MSLFGIVDDILGTDLSGEKAAGAAKKAADIQSASGQEALSVLRQDLAPFTGAGTEAASMLLGSLLQPVSAGEVTGDPFFQALATEQARGDIAARSALGLGGSGGTEELLQRNLLLLGEGFRQNKQAEQQAKFNQLFNVSQLGQASAAQTGLTGADIITSAGAAQSAAPLAEAQAAGQLTSGLMQMGGAALGGYLAAPAAGAALGGGSAIAGGSTMSTFSDSRLKNSIVRVGSDESGNVYEFSYNGVNGRYRGRIAQELQTIRPDAVSVHESGYLQVSDEFKSEAV
jgi:hypothetical protein